MPSQICLCQHCREQMDYENGFYTCSFCGARESAREMSRRTDDEGNEILFPAWVECYNEDVYGRNIIKHGGSRKGRRRDKKPSGYCQSESGGFMTEDFYPT